MEKRLGEIDVELAELAESLDAEDRNLDEIEEKKNALIEERKGIEKDIEERKAKEQALEEIRNNPAPIKIEEGGNKNMEVRNTKEYIDAYAEYIKSGNDAECRALLTELADDGSVPVPEIVEGFVTTAWDRLEVLSRARRTEIKGIVKVGFEKLASDAEYHTEGANAPNEEELVLGIVEMVPKTIKKWITVSDEALDLNGEAFLQYIYDELTYRVFKFAETEAVSAIKSLPAAATATSVSAGAVTVTEPSLADIINASALLADEASNLVVITSRANAAAYKALALNANFAFDPFEGYDVIYADGFGTDEGDTVAIVGDLNALQVNFTNGQDITIKVDDLSLAEKDLVKIVGRLPLAIGVVEDKRFASIKVEA